MATAFAIANRRDNRRLNKLREEGQKRKLTEEDRQRHESIVVAKMARRIWSPFYALLIGVAWPTTPGQPKPPAPDLFHDYRYWQARRCGWDVLLPDYSPIWEWWCSREPSERDELADMGWSRVLGTGDQIGEEVDPAQLFQGNVHVERTDKILVTKD